jgi:hypothetical protein
MDDLSIPLCEHDRVRLLDDLPSLALRAGVEGAVVNVYPVADVIEVEFPTGGGTVVATVGVDDVEKIVLRSSA